MLACGRFNIAQVSLRRDPIEERRLSGFITEASGLKRLSRLRHQFVAEEFDVVMRRLDFFQLIAEESECFLFLAIKSLLGGADVLASLAHTGRIFPRIQPWNGERDS